MACIFIYPFLSKKSYQNFVSVWPRLALWGAKVICKINWEINGLVNLPKGPAIVLSNHQSAWETLYFLAKFPRNVCYLYKRELNWIPIFGWNLSLLNMISIDRSRGAKAFRNLIQTGEKKIKEGFWIIIFPEGARDSSGKIGTFKRGGAYLSVRTGFPIIPIAHNSGHCWPKQSIIKRPGLITVSIGSPIYPEEMSIELVNQIARDWIEKETKSLAQERKSLS